MWYVTSKKLLVMKRIIFLICVMMLGISARAQRTDTMDVLYPDYHYYYQWWCDRWVDTTGAPLETSMDFYFTDRASLGANYNYTDKPLQVIGVAVSGWGMRDRMWSDNIPEEAVSDVVLYDAREDSCVLVARKPIDFKAPHQQLRMHYHGSSYTEGLPISYGCDNMYFSEGYMPLFETYFDHPVLVEDSFYVGATEWKGSVLAGHFLLYLALRGAGDMLTPAHLSDSCLNIPDERYLLVPYDSTAAYRYETLPVFRIFLPIIGVCGSVRDVRMSGYRQADSVVTVSWHSDDTAATSWEVSYGLGDIEPEDGTVITCNTTSATFRHIIPDTTYKAWVRAECPYNETSFWSDWVAGEFRYHAETDHGGGTDAIFAPVGFAAESVVLHPNPAQDNVTVSAPCPLSEVKLYDSNGRLVMQKKPNAESVLLDVSHLAAGTYLVYVATSQGTASKQLIIE